MTCYHPIKGRMDFKGEKRKFIPCEDPEPDEMMHVPCGRCIGCRLDYARDWAVRITKETKLYNRNSFITLTYDQDNLPGDGSLNVKHFQDFMKRLRKHYYPRKIRFFHCGEYGENTQRPHYHAILFNCDFSEDRELFNQNFQGDKLWKSNTLTSIWGKGHCLIGDVTFESASYVARYIMKKVNGDAAKEYYKRPHTINPDTGEILTYQELKPEYTTMSRKPGIGNGYYKRYFSDIFPDDFIIVHRIKNGKEIAYKNPVPRYYTELLKKEAETDPKKKALYDQIKDNRLSRAEDNWENNTFERLLVREEKKQRDITKLLRNLK